MARPEVSPGLKSLASGALEAWQLSDAKLEPISATENITFRVDAAEGTFVLRIHRPGYHSLAELQSEHVWTRALLAAGLDVPEPLNTTDGAGYISLPYEDGPRNIGMLKWVDGELLGGLIHRQPERVTEHFRNLGGIAAEIHNQSASWIVPQGFLRHSFDVEGLLGDKPFWGPFWELPGLDAAQKSLVLRARSVIAETLNQYGQDSHTYSLIHADLHPQNVVVSEHGLHVIDFDDSGFGWHQYELAVALYYYRKLPGFAEIQAAIIEGYRAVRSLSDDAVSLLPLFLLVRTLVSLGWRHQRPEHGTDLTNEITVACSEIEDWLTTQK
jgi:Ser/Thr protein kinase RdoA (MazF antagonist)